MTVGFLAGHEEKSHFDDYATFSRSLSEQYDLSTVSIDSKTGEMDVTPDILIIAGPKAEIPEPDKEAIRSYMNNGGKVLFLIDSVDINLQTLQVAVNENSMADLVEEFGVRVNQDVAGDLRSHENISLGSGFLSYVLPYPFWPRVAGSNKNPITSEIEMLAMPWTSTVSPVDDSKETTPLLQTTEAGFAEQGTINILPDREFNIPQKNLGQRTLALSAVNKQVEGQSSNDFRMVVIGDSDFITDDYAGSNSTALLFMLNAVDWLAQDEQLISVRSKQRQASSLVFEKDGQKNTVKYVNLIGLPILVAIFGFVYLYRRKKITKRTYANE